MGGQNVKWREYIRKRWFSKKRGGDINIRKKKVTIRTLREKSE